MEKLEEFTHFSYLRLGWVDWLVGLVALPCLALPLEAYVGLSLPTLSMPRL